MNIATSARNRAAQGSAVAPIPVPDPELSLTIEMKAKPNSRRDTVYIGRVWPAWPTYARVSIGTKEVMVKFKTAL
jgi:hypothetical protein